MDIALAQLALVFLPGIIWASMNETYGTGPRITSVKLALHSFLFGVTTYSVLYLIYSVIGTEFSVHSIENHNTLLITDFIDEITWSIPLSILLSIFWLYAVRFRWVMKILSKIGASSRFGPEDVWSFTFNSTQAHVEYVDIRDLENGFIFSGFVNAYSENEEVREILLRDAIVYDAEGVEISRPPHLYLSRDRSNLWIEFPYREDQ